MGSEQDYKLIPFAEITHEARGIAVSWVDNYCPHSSINPEIAQKHKLASDIMNYARNDSLNFAEFIRHNFNDSVVDSWTRNSDDKIFFDIDDVYDEYLKDQSSK